MYVVNVWCVFIQIIVCSSLFTETLVSCIIDTFINIEKEFDLIIFLKNDTTNTCLITK